MQVPAFSPTISGGLYAAILWTCCAVAEPLAPFVDVAAELGLTRVHASGSLEKGYIPEAKGGGSAALDFDNDGDPDLYWVNGLGGGHALYRNDGSTGFVDVGEAFGVAGRGWGMGATSADFDNDGDPDLYATQLRENALYRNDGDRFVDVGETKGVATAHWSTGAAWADYDRDGDLDLYVASYAVFDSTEVERLGAQWKGVEVFVGPRGLMGAEDVLYRNDGDEFADVTAWARLNHPSPGYGLGVLFADADADGWPDLFVANDSSPNFFYRNRGDGRFIDRSLPARLAYGRSGQIQASMGIAWGDYDNDGRPDLLATHFADEYNTLYRNEGDGLFADVSAEAALARVSRADVGFGAGFFDFDHDGDLDLLVANGHVYPQIDRAGSGSAYAQANHLFANVGDGTFTQVALSAEVPRVSRGTNMFDFDNDGDLDVFIANLDERPSLLRNDVGQRKNWLGLRLVGRRGNRDGIGTRARLVAGQRTQIRDLICGSSFLSSEDRRLHFGLGRVERVDTLEVRWPDQRREIFIDLPVNRYLTIEESSSEP